MAWDIFIGILIVYSVLVIPIQMGFPALATTGDFENLTYVEYALDFVFLFDMIAAFNTAYYSAEDDAYVTIRRKIAINYFRSWFTVDLLSTVPFDLIVSSTTPAGSRWSSNIPPPTPSYPHLIALHFNLILIHESIPNPIPNPIPTP